jgi:hypothetical protein
MRDRPLDGRISFAQRERFRRGSRVAACDVSSRWLRFGEAFDPSFGEGDSVWVDVLTDIYHEEAGLEVPPRTKKLTSLMVRVEDLRAILEQLDEDIYARVDVSPPSQP